MDDGTRSLYEERGLGRRQGAGTRPALVVVDMNYGFTDPESPLHCDTDRAVAANVRLLAAARDAGCPIAFTTLEYDAAGQEVARAFINKVPTLLTLAPGTRWPKIDERIAPRPGEPVLSKLFASAFFGTPLGALLASHHCDTVVVTGASTSGCVRATAVDGMQYGYRVVVPRDAVADRAAGPHEASLFDIDAKYGDVLSTRRDRDAAARG
ncbi:MAG: isochorismatase family protein [Solirubrobacteraceae bacterium]